MDQDGRCLALSGGIGGAKLALGLSRVLAPDLLTVVANTGDDFRHFGLYICPDLDTVMYTLADRSNREAGWGLAGESWNFLEALESLGQDSWFQLGDRDLATHVTRTKLLAEGRSLTEATEYLCARFGLNQRVVPMSDQPVSTMVHLKSGGELAFQHYFVRDRCEPEVSGFHFEGIDAAKPSPPFHACCDDPALSAIVVCPSNPFVSIDPILSLPGIADRLASHAAPVVAVSPIVGGEAIKGPTAKMMRELGMPTTPRAVVEHYADLLDGVMLDSVDRDHAPEIERLGVATTVTDTVMVTLDDRVRLAEEALAFAAKL